MKFSVFNLQKFKDFIRNPLIASLFGVSFFIFLANIGSLFFFVKDFNKVVILHYNVFLGIDLVGSGKHVFLMPLVGLFFLCINFALAHHFFNRKERIISHMLSLTSFIVQLGIGVATIAFIVVNYY